MDSVDRLAERVEWSGSGLAPVDRAALATTAGHPFPADVASMSRGYGASTGAGSAMHAVPIRRKPTLK